LRRKREMSEILKKTKKLVSAKKLDEAKLLIPKAYKAIDKAAKRGIIKNNTASRKKSRLMHLLGKST